MVDERRIVAGLRSDDRAEVLRTIDELEESLRSREWTARFPPSVSELLSLKDEEIRTKATWIVGKFAQNKLGGDYPIDDLVVLLSDANEEVRENSAWAIGELASLGECGAREAEALTSVLDDVSSQVRGMAAWALGRLAERRDVRSEKTKTMLEALLQDRSEYVKRTAAWALERF